MGGGGQDWGEGARRYGGAERAARGGGRGSPRQSGGWQVAVAAADGRRPPPARDMDAHGHTMGHGWVSQDARHPPITTLTAGFGWALRAVGFIALGLMSVGIALVRSRLPRKKLAPLAGLLRPLSEAPFALLALGAALSIWG